MGVMDRPETSVRNYHTMLRRIPKQRRSHARCYIPEEGYGQTSICKSSANIPTVAFRFLILGALAKSRKATDNCVMSVCLSVCLSLCLSVRPHETTRFPLDEFLYKLIFFILLIYLLTAIELIPGGSSTAHIYTQTIRRTTQLTTLVGRLSWIRTQSGQTKINDEQTA
jgi:hypothetical protein